MYCSKCGSTKRLIKINKSKKKQYYYCNKCNTERVKKYRTTKEGKESVKRATVIRSNKKIANK